LTDAELLIVWEGNVSDVHLDTSDDELDLVSDTSQPADPTNNMVSGLDPEMIDVHVKEDDVHDKPLSLRFQWLVVQTQNYKVFQICHTLCQNVSFAGVGGYGGSELTI
jgi:hypothetical protein